MSLREKVRELTDRVIAMLPAARPIFEVGKDQKLTIIMEPIESKVQAAPQVWADDLKELLDAIDVYAIAVRDGGSPNSRALTFETMLLRRAAFK
jgi:hypothetical protein